MGKASVSERVVGEALNTELTPEQIQQIRHKKRQFKGYHWFSDYFERRDKNWLMDGTEEAITLNLGLSFVDVLKALKRIVCRGSKGER